MTEIEHSFGRQAFGEDPANYDTARPSYPDWVFEMLMHNCGLGVGSAVFEIGAGTGTATRPVLRMGADPLVAIEPDERLAAFLRRACPSSSLQILIEPFETADLSERGFDLGLAATAFHWLDEEVALAKIAALLKPGGWWTALWNVFGDDSRPDPFHEATRSLLSDKKSPSAGTGGVPFALDTTARIAALRRAQAFECIEHHVSRWELVLTAHQTVALYATYSDITARPDRADVLLELRRIAESEFAGRVTRNMSTSLFLARRRA
jgi:SAM-dependent methyltransferase